MGNTKIQNYLFEILLCFLFLTFSLPSQAAQLYFEPSTQELGFGQEFEITLLLDAENQNINALEGKIVFINDFLELIDARDGGSVVNLWIQKPEKDAEKEEVVFAGAISGGCSGKKEKILSLIFKTKDDILAGKEEINGLVEIKDAKILLNDGQGAEADFSTSNFKFLISKRLPVYQLSPLEDQKQPEFFKPEIGYDSQIFNNRYFLVFAAEDKESGIDYYEVKEGERPFIRAKSPYLLKNQGLYDEIIVRVFDKAGNVREVAISPSKKCPFYLNLTFWLIAIFILLLFVITIYFIKNHFKFKNYNYNSKFRIFFILIIFISIAGHKADAASLYLSPPSGDFNTAQSLTTTLYVSASDQPINAVRATIYFSKDKLEIIDVSKENSIINLWIQEPIGSNIDGTIQFEGISLNPGFSGFQGKIISLVFKVKDAGQAALTISQASILANDGIGTEILSSASGAQFNLLPSPIINIPEPAIPAQEESPQEEKIFLEPSIPKSKLPELKISPENIELPTMPSLTSATPSAVKLIESSSPAGVKQPKLSLIKILKQYLIPILIFIISLILIVLCKFYKK